MLTTNHQAIDIVADGGRNGSWRIRLASDRLVLERSDGSGSYEFRRGSDLNQIRWDGLATDRPHLIVRVPTRTTLRVNHADGMTLDGNPDILINSVENAERSGMMFVLVGRGDRTFGTDENPFPGADVFAMTPGEMVVAEMSRVTACRMSWFLGWLRQEVDGDGRAEEPPRASASTRSPGDFMEPTDYGGPSAVFSLSRYVVSRVLLPVASDSRALPSQRLSSASSVDVRTRPYRSTAISDS
jgi:hypothetical protein